MPYTQVTWATLRGRLQARLDSSQHWDNVELLDTFNDVLFFWNLLTGQWRQTVTVTFQPASDPYLFLSSTMIWPLRVELTDGTLVTKTSITLLDQFQPEWENELTSDADTPGLVTNWAPRSLQLFAIWPRPIVATPLLFDGVMETPTLLNDGDFVDLDEGEHDVFLNLSAHWLLWKDGGPKFFSTLPALKAFVAAAGEKNAEIKSTSLWRNMMFTDTDPEHRLRLEPTLERPFFRRGQVGV